MKGYYGKFGGIKTKFYILSIDKKQRRCGKLGGSNPNYTSEDKINRILYLIKKNSS